MPGIHKVNEALVYKFFNLYLAGKTYDEISQITREKKDLIIFLSERFGWFPAKVGYLKSLNDNMVAKVAKTKLESINFLTNLMTFYHRFYSKKMDDYLASGNDEDFHKVDLRYIEKYMKAIDQLDKLMPGQKKGKDSENPGTPFAEIHLTGNAEITSDGPGRLKVKQEPINNISELAQMKRDIEANKEE